MSDSLIGIISSLLITKCVASPIISAIALYSQCMQKSENHSGLEIFRWFSLCHGTD